ncbi:MAG: S46 family peptidase [Alistipes sp.]|nr:S46 family peptidase [Alistipes sp.]
MIRRILLTLALLPFLIPGAKADEGMWLPKLVGQRIDDMQGKGLMLGAADIYNEDGPSMKDAIVKFGSGCTGELISAEGLLVTNHHCGYGQIQRHSSVEHNYLDNGFWAMDRSQELPNPGLEVTFLVRMEDVTDRVLNGTAGLAEGPELDSVVRVNIERIVEQAEEGTHYKASVSRFYYGNQYYLYVNEIFTDVRLVAAPPSAIGKFGGDTDNWMWPRHTGDFSLFRIYAGPDNKPAPYSKDNVPYRPRHYFPVSTQGVAEGDFTLVYGFPGSTQQFITSDAVDYVLNYSNPAKIELRTMRLAIIENAWQDSEAIRIAYTAKHSGIANAWKKWQGESLGLRRLGTIQKKIALEEAFEQWAAGNPGYEGITRKLSRTHADLLPYAYATEYYSESLRAIELISFASRLSGLKAGTVLPDWAENFYKDYYPEIDRQIARYLTGKYIGEFENDWRPDILQDMEEAGVEEFISGLFDHTRLTDRDAVTAALGDSVSWAEFTAADPAMAAFRNFDQFYGERLLKPYSQYRVELNGLYKTWVKGLTEYRRYTGGATDLFPDANLTLRFAYGKVEGYDPEDAVRHKHNSTVAGILGKYATGHPDYDLPENVLELFYSRDYGRWEMDSTVPVCFLASNHTTGGNSGSPVINGNGELVGINFDRTWMSTMSDIEFDPQICRNISLDIRYMLYVIDKLGGASYLFDEMTLK